MDITCEKCQAKFKIPDEKIPKGQSVSIPCPKCKNKISINQKPEAPVKAAPVKSPEPEPSGSQTSAGEPAAAESDASSSAPLAILDEDTETALICESDPAIRSKIKSVLEKMKYVISLPDSPREALKQMRFQDFNIIAINEKFGTRDPDMNHVLKYMGQQPMNVRRNIFVALLTDRFQTNDSMMTYNRSVNLIINLKDIDDVEKVLKRGLSENKAFYRIFKETRIKLGKV